MGELMGVPAVFMRGGTSKALMFRRQDLPHNRDLWTPLFLAAMGSPDENKRQLDGMGGGISSLSKVCVVERSSSPEIDLDYTFVQVLVDQARADYTSNCGNMASAVGPFAIDCGMLGNHADGEITVRIRNTNTGKRLDATFAIRDGAAAVEGDYRLDGVAGTGASIRLDFLDPGGAGTGKLLPTGKVRDCVTIPGLGRVEYSLVDAGNPCMFVHIGSLGLGAVPTLAEIEVDQALLTLLEELRRHGSVAAGAAPDIAAASTVSVPRIALVSQSAETITSSGRTLHSGDVDIVVRAISRGRPHRAVPVTGSLCLAVACTIPGSVPNELVRPTALSPGSRIRIGHPSGVSVVAAETAAAVVPVVKRASIFLTARRLFQGEVLVRRSRLLAS